MCIRDRMKEYALQVLQAAADGGADCLCLCDTNGGALPNEIFFAVSEVSQHFPDKKIAIHCHDDIGCAVASSMLAVEAGASQVQGTFIGFGERLSLIHIYLWWKSIVCRLSTVNRWNGWMILAQSRRTVYI